MSEHDPQFAATVSNASVAHLDYKIFDCDNHMQDTEDCCIRNMPAAFKNDAIHYKINQHGMMEVLLGDEPIAPLTGEVFFDRAVRPGTLIEKLKNLSSGEGLGDYNWDIMRPEYQNRDARLKAMDSQNVEGCLMFPDLSLYLDHPIVARNPKVQYANVRSYNQWFHEEWGFAYKERIFGVPIIPLRDLDSALAELDIVLKQGARTIGFRPGPVNGRHPTDPYFDRFWARCNEAHITVAIHLAEAGYNEILGPAWGEDPNLMAMRQSAFQWYAMYGTRPIMDTIASIIFSNFFEAFPNIMVMSVENGAEWVPQMLKDMDKCRGLARNGAWLRGRSKERPSEIARKHLRVTPYPEDNIPKLIDLIGNTDIIVFGSDWPHAEGTTSPGDFIHSIQGLDAATQKKIMRDQGRRALRLDV
jgi:predicted TIM-barrel fold metal-dependent hydrolase